MHIATLESQSLALHRKAELRVARGGGGLFIWAIDSLSRNWAAQTDWFSSPFRVWMVAQSVGRSDIYEKEHQKRWEPSPALRVRPSVERTEQTRTTDE